MSETLGVIGVGSFASYLVEGLLRSDPTQQIILSPRNREHTRKLHHRFGLTIAANNSEVVAGADIVILATRPIHIFESIENLPWRKEQIAISVAAGVTRSELLEYVSPAEVVLSMPTNSGMIGSAAIPMYPYNSNAEQLLSRLGKTFIIEDEDVYRACTTLGAYFGWLLALTEESARWLEEKGTNTALARRMVSQAFRSVANIVEHRDQENLRLLVDELRTPGGLTEHGLDLFEETKAIKEWSNVLDTIYNRLSRRY
ncbi:MAG: NAD(P)-binding domain-containing protein [Arenicellales bacterium]|nr:NAD(P)-binding domain-containing protein [Arenicellales bacterium]